MWTTRHCDATALSVSFVEEISRPVAAAMNYVNAARHLLDRADVEVSHLPAEHLRQASRQLARAGTILRYAWYGAPPEESDTCLQELGSAIRDAITLASFAVLDGNQHIQLDMSPDTQVVLVEPVRFTQMIVSLVQNAATMLPSRLSPEIRITVRACPQQDRIAIAILAGGMAGPARNGTSFLRAAPTEEPPKIAPERAVSEMWQGGDEPVGRDDGGVAFRFLLPVLPAGMRDA